MYQESFGGEDISQDFLTKLKERRINFLSNPDDNLPSNSPYIFVGYLSALLGGILGIITGYAIWTNKKTLPNGKRVPVYSKANQTHGKIIFIIGVSVFIISIISLLFNYPLYLLT